MEESKAEETQPTQRPFGVWFLTIYAAIFAGVAPFVLAIIVIFSSGISGAFNTVSLMFSIGLNACVVVTAVFTWKGNRKAKNWFLVFVTANYLLIGINNYALLASGDIPTDEQARLIGRIVRGVFYPAIFIYYFARPHTKLFYSD